MNQINTNKEYQEYVNQKSPNSPIFRNCFNSFWVGGLICAIGQIIMEICKYRGLDTEMSATIVSISLIFLSAFLTALNIFNKIGKFAGAGSLVPITGFANSIVSPAMEYKSEGYRTFCAFFRNVCDLLEVRNVDNILISQKLHLAFHFFAFYHKPLDNGVAFPLLHLQLGDEVREYTTYDEIVQTD